MFRMLSSIVIAAAFLAASPFPSRAENAPTMPYAGQEQREIKALAPEDVRALEKGEGMGLAKAAELNRYPGPRHVLDLAEKLELTPAQRAETERVFSAMHAEAVKLGRDILEAERNLDARFRTGTLDDAELVRLTQKLGVLSGRLRASHLRAHLQLRAVLTDEQVERYQHLRGYGTPTQGHDPSQGHSHSH